MWPVIYWPALLITVLECCLPHAYEGPGSNPNSFTEENLASFYNNTVHHFAEYIVVKWSKQLMQVFSMNISIKIIVYSKKLGQRLKLNRFKLNSSQQCFHTRIVESKNKNDRKTASFNFKN